VAISCSTNTSYLHLSYSLEKHIVMCPVLGCPFSRTLPVTPFHSLVLIPSRVLCVLHSHVARPSLGFF
jgi:hypothetical protein